MKILDTPRTGKLGRAVAYPSPYGLCLRERVVPRNNRSEAQQHMRAVFGRNSRMWSASLTQEQQDHWNYAGSQVMTHPRLATYGPMSGEQLFTGLNSVLGCVGLPPLFEPPAREVFPPNPTGAMVITNDEHGVRLFLEMPGEVTTDIMVFGQEPCSSGRRKRRNVSYLGLLPPPIDGRSEITALYKAKFGEPRPDKRVFIVTCQQKNGWKGQDAETSEIVPNPPEGLLAAPQAAATETPAPLKPSASHPPHLHKGSTRAALGIDATERPASPQGKEPREGGGKAAGAAIGEGGGGRT